MKKTLMIALALASLASLSTARADLGPPEMRPIQVTSDGGPVTTSDGKLVTEVQDMPAPPHTKILLNMHETDRVGLGLRL